MLGSILGSAGSAAGRRTRSAAAGDRLDAAENKLEGLHRQLEDLEVELTQEVTDIDAKWMATAKNITDVDGQLGAHRRQGHPTRPGLDPGAVGARSRASAYCRHCCYNASMPVAITIRNVPDQVRNELASRAALKGWSLQEFLLSELVELSKRPDRQALLAHIERRLDGTVLTAAQLAALSDAERR